MVKENKTTGKVPNLRFPGFDEEWVSTSLGQVTKLITKGTTPDRFVEQGVKFIKIECFEGDQINAQKCLFINEETHRKELKRSILQEGDLLFAIAGATIGKVNKVNRKLLPANTNQALAIIRLKASENSNFIYQILKSDIMKKYIKDSIAVGAQPNLNLEQMANFKFFQPNVAEQNKIAHFLSLIDQRIRTQNKIIGELKVLKNNVTKRIFSRQYRMNNENGSAFPEWKKMKLGDIGEVKMCRRIFSAETSSTGEIPFFKIGSFGKEADAFISRELYLDYRTRFAFPKMGDILISAAGTIGRTVVYQGEDAYYQDSNIVWIDNDNSVVENKFLYYILQDVKYNTEGGTIQRLYNSILKSTKFSCPTLPEQKKITNLLSSIDLKIDVEDQLLLKLAQQKKFLLQQMFV